MLNENLPDQSFKLTLSRGQETFTLEGDEYGMTIWEFTELILPFILSAMTYSHSNIGEIMDSINE